MNDFIKKSEALENLKKLPASLDSETVQRCIETISNMPTVEAEPVRHGKWIEEDDYEYGENTWRCSVCGEPYVLIEGTPKQNLYNYCPNCGAKMDEGKEG